MAHANVIVLYEFPLMPLSPEGMSATICTVGFDIVLVLHLNLNFVCL